MDKLFPYQLLFLAFIYLLSSEVLPAQDTLSFRHHIGWNILPLISAVAPHSRGDKIQLVYKYHWKPKIEFRTKISYFKTVQSFIVKNYSLAGSCQVQRADKTITNRFDAEKGWGLNLGLVWRPLRGRISFYMGGDLFFNRISGSIISDKWTCYLQQEKEVLVVQLFGTNKAGYNQLGISPLLGLEAAPTDRIFILLEFGWNLFTRFGKGKIYDNKLVEIRHRVYPPIAQLEPSQPHFSDLTIGYKF